MTREQARREIDSLDFYLQNHTDDYGEESHAAMMMAKDALSSSEKPNKWMSEARRWKRRYLDLKHRYIVLEQQTRWIPVSERLPEKRGDYLVTQKASFSDYVYRSVVGYALNLHDVDEYDFADKKRPGWYEYDSEWGYHELDNVIAWMPLPTPFRAESEEQE